VKFRKKPVVIEARRFGAYTEAMPPAPWNENKGGDLWAWVCGNGGRLACRQDADNEAAYAIVQTLEGAMRAEIGDWIIRGVQGEFYPCKPDLFAATYEPVEEA